MPVIAATGIEIKTNNRLPSVIIVMIVTWKWRQGGKVHKLKLLTLISFVLYGSLETILGGISTHFQSPKGTAHDVYQK